MKAKLIFIVLFIAFFSTSVFACSCAFVDNFCETITAEDGTLWEGLQIFQVKVTGQGNTGISVKVLNVLHGKDHLDETLFFINGSGVDCTMGTSGFQVGKEFIFAAWPRQDNWSLSICGISFLEVENGNVKGAIAPGINKLSLEEFGKVANCGNLNGVGPGISGNELSTLFQVFPSPVSETLTLKPANDTLVFSLDLEVFDALGRLVHREREAPFGNGANLRIMVSNWSNGVYFFRVTAWDRRHTFKVVKAG